MLLMGSDIHPLFGKDEGAGKGKHSGCGEKKARVLQLQQQPSLTARCFQAEAKRFFLLPFSSALRVRACCQDDPSGSTLPQRRAGHAAPRAVRHSARLRRSSAHEQIHSRQDGAEGARPGSSAGGKAAGVC